MTQHHPDLADEQAYIDHAYDCLERSREAAWKLRDLNEAVIRGNTSLNGGDLSSSNGIRLESGVSLTGNGTVSGEVSGAVGSAIIASSTGLTLGDAGSASGFDFAELPTIPQLPAAESPTADAGAQSTGTIATGGAIQIRIGR